MADFAIKQHDTWPHIEATLSDLEGPLNLTTAAQVRLLLRGTKRVAPASVAGTCTILNAASGIVRYEWAPGDTSVADLYQAEFEIQWADGSVGTVPNDRYFYVLIPEDLG